MAFNVSYIFEAIDRFTPTLKKINKVTENVEKTIKKTSGTVKKFGSISVLEFKRMKRAIREMEFSSKFGFNSMANDMNKTAKAFKNFGNKAKDLGRDLMFKVSLPIVAMGGFMVKAAMDFEDATMLFKTMLGSATKAKKLLNDLEQMAIKTPFETKDLIRNTKLLLNFGMAQKDILPTLTALGDISGGNKDRFNRLSLAFAQASAQGRLMGQDLLQMVNAGFNPLQIISEKTGRSMEDLRDIMRRGGITFKDLQKAIKDATSEGGKFFNLMSERSKTASGRLSTLQDKIGLLARDLGLLLLPYVKIFLEKMITLVDKFEALNPSMKKTILIIGGIAAIIPPIIFGFGLLAVSISSIITLFGAGGLAGAMNLAAFNLGAIGGAISTAGAAIGTILTPLTGLITLAASFGVGFMQGLAPIMPELKIIGGFILDVFVKPLKTVLGILAKILEGWRLIGNLVGTGISRAVLGDEEYKRRTQIPGYKPSKGALVKNTENISKVAIDMAINAPKNVVKSVQSRASGNNNVGFNMMGMAGAY